ncbi:MAG TPA: M48 family metallopeptidase, partial [Pyrinomonadaceae bacterium]
MTREEYEAMVSRLEEVARRDPAKYRMRVGLLAALGYGYIIAVVGLLVAAGVGLIVVSWRTGRVVTTAIKFIWLTPLALAWFVLKALWVRIPPPEGLEIKRADAPELFAAVDEITASLAAPKITRVLIDTSYNAGVVQHPRLGPLGWFRNYIILGLPLMQALSPAHFRAVLGHELGHLSGNHGRFSGWIYRVRETWLMLLQRFHVEQRWGAFIFNWFFDWYAPYFYAYSFVLARTHEYEADAAAARMAGPGVMAEALIAFRTMGAHLSEGYWPAVFKEADTAPRPVRGAFARLS